MSVTKIFGIFSSRDVNASVIFHPKNHNSILRNTTVIIHDLLTILLHKLKYNLIPSRWGKKMDIFV